MYIFVNYSNKRGRAYKQYINKYITEFIPFLRKIIKRPYINMVKE